METVEALASGVVGGLLVLAGQFWSQRGADQRHWQTLVRQAAAGVSTSFASERARLTLDRRYERDHKASGDTTYIEQRQEAYGSLRSLPGGGAFETEIAAMADRLDELWGAFELDDRAWEEARENLKQAISGFEKQVRESL